MKSDIGRLCLGTAQFSSYYGATNRKGQPSHDEVFDIIALAYEAGIRFADTAYDYYWPFNLQWNVITKVKAA